MLLIDYRPLGSEAFPPPFTVTSIGHRRDLSNLPAQQPL